ncbi:MAG TPA: 50S ribosomal protein L11 methyltransferase, partial [Actinomycetota bacterium]|nr:50S ribosomal protein L11 methyltransferase [Actinomycetota bacterium]
MAGQTTAELEWKGRTGPFTIRVNPGVFAPTHTSRTIAEALEITPGDTVIDVGCGSGVLSFVAARLGAARVIGCDISSEAVEVARGNARLLGLEDRVEFRVGSLLDPVRGERASVIIGDVSGIPDEIAEVSGWFPDGRAGGPTGAELPAAMLESIRENDCLAPGGRLYLPTGTIQNESRILEVARRIFGAANLHSLLSREFPLPDVVARSKAVARMMKEGVLDLHARGS